MGSDLNSAPGAIFYRRHPAFFRPDEESDPFHLSCKMILSIKCIDVDVYCVTWLYNDGKIVNEWLPIRLFDEWQKCSDWHAL